MKKSYSIQHLAPYLGRLNETLVRKLINEYTKVGDLVLDPFVGSGVVAMEALIAGRSIISCDVNPYAVVVTKGKIKAPPNLRTALTRAKIYLRVAELLSPFIGTIGNEPWVKAFFHPRTLRETLALARILRLTGDYFLLSCLLGILHHQRPGFLSYPASHVVPYLRNKKFPRKEYPEMYGYRDIASRLIKKILRVYKTFPHWNRALKAKCYKRDSTRLRLKPNSIDSIITSPPYMNALSYGRDNRLRLRFVGEKEYTKYDVLSPRTPENYRNFMEECFNQLGPAIKPGGSAIFVIGEVKRNGRYVNTSEILLEAVQKCHAKFSVERVELNPIPDVKRTRRNSRGTRNEWVVILRKKR